MIDILSEAIANRGDRVKIIPISRLPEIKRDIEDLRRSQPLTNFQKYIVNDLYRLDPSDTDFDIASILIVASPSPPLAQIIFNRNGKSIPLLLPASYIDKEAAPPRIQKYLHEFLAPGGYHVQYAPRLPRKLLAARSGLGAYGRNNICYVEGMGSFLNLTPFFSDIPATAEDWHEIRPMALCNDCNACLKNCPTAAITAERFLINNERCLTYFNEAGGEWDFPEWIDRSAHHCLYGCLKCQIICPKNREYLNQTMEPLEFSETETRLLLEGKPAAQFPEELALKVEQLAMGDYLAALPRNLKVLLDAR
jgi:epoxyqueuosine reductase